MLKNLICYLFTIFLVSIEGNRISGQLILFIHLLDSAVSNFVNSNNFFQGLDDIL